MGKDMGNYVDGTHGLGQLQIDCDRSGGNMERLGIGNWNQHFHPLAEGFELCASLPFSWAVF